jgi:predicted RNA binding protein YcfA (HicA-like mRNA interferase family)
VGPGDARREVEEAFGREGTEALAWYQSFHEWAPGYWGIYVDEEAALLLALDLYNALVAANASDPRRATEIVNTLLLAHETFHCRVEAFASSGELARTAASYRAYGRMVYERVLGTKNALEEALGNWTAYRAVEQLTKGWESSQQWTEQSTVAVLDYVRVLFAMSPGGYRDWQQGDDPLAWRRLTNEVLSGKRADVRQALPLEGLLRADHAVIRGEVPVRYVVSTAASMQRFGTPKRKHAQGLLREAGYELQRKRGKGSHEVWSHSDGKIFTLPATDPLSNGVFRQLLDVLGVSRRAYYEGLDEKRARGRQTARTETSSA